MRFAAPSFRIDPAPVDVPGMRGSVNSDQSFWSKPIDAEAGWMDDLSTEPVDTVDAAETHALDEFAAGRHGPTDRVFHELRDVAIEPVGDGVVGAVASRSPTTSCRPRRATPSTSTR